MATTRSTVALLALAGAGGAAWGASLYQWLHPTLPGVIQQSLARLLGVEEGAVAVGRARLGWPARLVVDDLAAGNWAAAHLEVDVDPWAALGGRPRLSRLRARDLVSELGRVDEAEATLAHGRARVGLKRVTLQPSDHWLGGLGLTVADAGLEIEGGALKRLAFSGARVGDVGELAGVAGRAPDGSWLVRAARPGLAATARVDGEGLAGQARLERFALGCLPAPRGLELAGASASGSVTFSVDGQGARVEPRLSVDGVTLDHPALASRPVDGVAATVNGELALVGGTLVARALRIDFGRATLVLDGSVNPGAEFDLTASLPRLPCADLLASVPRALRPHLDGLIVDGEMGGRLHLAGDAADAATLVLEVDGAIGCHARADAALADVGALAHPEAAALIRHTVDGRLVALSPKNPSWRALDSLPPSLVRAFLVAEDGRFFVHHGFDVERIGHALAADLDAGKFDRGASTITQQVAKNLWLKGERTLSRKLEEAVLAWRLEQVLDKRRILELYVNLVELGPGVFGVQDAAATYFGKLPDELGSDEAAQLAALLPAPRRGMDAAWQRRYRALAARLPSEKVQLPPPATAPTTSVRLSRR